MSTRDIMLSTANRLGATEAEQVLFAKIMRAESGGQANAKNSRSTATGIFQFLEQTWLQELKENGAEHGYGALAAQITRGRDGKLHAPASVLALRNDPEISTVMMYEFTEGNRAGLKATLGREPTAGELYLAHFAGLGGAKEVLNAAPGTALRDLPIMRRALGANPSIANFSAGQLRAWAISKMDGRIDEVLAYNAAPAPQGSDEEEEEMKRRRRSLRLLGKSEEEIDEIEARGDLKGAAFVGLLGLIISALAGISQQNVEQTYGTAIPSEPAESQADRVPATGATVADPALAAAVAAVPGSLRGQSGEPADQTSPSVQLTSLTRPAAPATRSPIPA